MGYAGLVLRKGWVDTKKSIRNHAVGGIVIPAGAAALTFLWEWQVAGVPLADVEHLFITSATRGLAVLGLIVLVTACFHVFAAPGRLHTQLLADVSGLRAELAAERATPRKVSNAIAELRAFPVQFPSGSDHTFLRCHGLPHARQCCATLLLGIYGTSSPPALAVPPDSEDAKRYLATEGYMNHLCKIKVADWTEAPEQYRISRRERRISEEERASDLPWVEGNAYNWIRWTELGDDVARVLKQQAADMSASPTSPET